MYKNINKFEFYKIKSEKNIEKLSNVFLDFYYAFCILSFEEQMSLINEFKKSFFVGESYLNNQHICKMLSFSNKDMNYRIYYSLDKGELFAVENNEPTYIKNALYVANLGKLITSTVLIIKTLIEQEGDIFVNNEDVKIEEFEKISLEFSRVLLSEVRHKIEDYCYLVHNNIKKSIGGTLYCLTNQFYKDKILQSEYFNFVFPSIEQASAFLSPEVIGLKTSLSLLETSALPITQTITPLFDGLTRNVYLDLNILSKYYSYDDIFKNSKNRMLLTLTLNDSNYNLLTKEDQDQLFSNSIKVVSKLKNELEKTRANKESDFYYLNFIKNYYIEMKSSKSDKSKLLFSNKEIDEIFRKILIDKISEALLFISKNNIDFDSNSQKMIIDSFEDSIVILNGI